MIKALTLRMFPADMSWRDCMREARNAGYQGVEINFDGALGLDCPLATLREMKAAARSFDLRIVSVYSRNQWMTPISSADPMKRKQGQRVLETLLHHAENLEAGIVLTIPGAVDNALLCPNPEIVPYADAYARTRETLSSLAPLAAQCGCVLALENVHNRFLLSPLEMKRLVEEIGSPAVGCYFDVANCLFGNGIPQDWIGILGRHIRAVHVKDYRLGVGAPGGFVNVFEGDVDWPAVCAALKAVPFDGPLVAEVLPAFRHHPEMLWQNAGLALDCLMKDLSAGGRPARISLPRRGRQYQAKAFIRRAVGREA